MSGIITENSWSILFCQNELTYTDVIQLKLEDVPQEGPEGTQLTPLGKTS